VFARPAREKAAADAQPESLTASVA
jgi:hypothetical protein